MIQNNFHAFQRASQLLPEQMIAPLRILKERL